MIGIDWSFVGTGYAETAWIGDQQVTFRLSGDNSSVGVSERTIPPGSGSPIHSHPGQDETQYVLEGEFEFLCNDDRMKGGPGTVVHVAKQVPHAFRNIGGSEGRISLVTSPGGPLEKFLREVGLPSQPPPGPPDMEMITEAAQRTGGIDILAPPDAWQG